MKEVVCPNGFLWTPALRWGHHSQAIVHVNSFTVLSGTWNLELALRKFRQQRAPPPPHPHPCYFHSQQLRRDPSLSPPHPGAFLPGLRKVRKFLPASARGRAHGGRSAGLSDRQRPGRTGCRLPATARSAPPSLALQRAEPAPLEEGGERRAGGRHGKPALWGTPPSPWAARPRGPRVYLLPRLRPSCYKYLHLLPAPP